MGEDVDCDECGYWRGTPNTLDKKGEYTKFVCKGCKIGDDRAEERAEKEMGA